MNRNVLRLVLGLALAIPTTKMLLGANKTWTNAVNGNFSDATKWSGGAPGLTDSATFSATGTPYSVTLTAGATNNDLFDSANTVTFQSGIGGPFTYALTGTGGQDSFEEGGNGVTFNLGNGAGTAVNMTVGSFIGVATGANLNIRTGSKVTVNNSPFVAVGQSGTIIVDGTGSNFAFNNSSAIALIGGTTQGSITFQNSSTGSFAGDIQVSNSTGATGSFGVIDGAVVNTGGNLFLASADNSGANASLLVNGSGSILSLGTNSGMTVGSPTNGAALVSVGPSASGATLTTGTGGLVINATGSVALGDGNHTGTLNVNGDITVTGGTGTGLNVNSGSTLAWAPGRIMTVQNGGKVNFSDSYTTPSSTILISGSGSKLQSTGGSLNISSSNMNVSSGGAVSANAISLQSASSLIADGAGTVVNVGGLSAGNSGLATVDFSNGANGQFSGGLQLANSTVAGSSANVTVESGATLTNIGSSFIGNGSHAAVTVTGAHSTVTMAAGHALTIGTTGMGPVLGTLTLASGGTWNSGVGAPPDVVRQTGLIDIQAGGIFNENGELDVNGLVNCEDGGTLNTTAGGSTVLSGSITVNGGVANLGSLFPNGGSIGLYAGSLSFLGNLNTDPGQPLGAAPYINAVSSLTVSGTTTVTPFHQLTIGGGTLSTGSLVVNTNGVLSFPNGTLNITGATGLSISASGPLRDNVVLNAGQSLNVTNSVSVGSGSTLSTNGGTFTTNSSITSSGNIVVNSGTFKLAFGLANLSGAVLVVGQNATATIGLNITNVGEIQLGGGSATLMGSGATGLINTGLVRGDGIIAKAVNNNAGGEIRAESGKRIKLSGTNGTNLGKIDLQDGTAEFTQPLTNGTTGQIEGRGTLIAGGTGLTNNGNIALSSGITDVFGDVNNATNSSTKGITISGNADVTFWDDVTNGAGSLFKVSSGASVTVFGTYSGAGISGNANDIHLEADVSPGFSPASVDFGGNLEFSSTTRLKIELGGTTPGTQFDQVHVSERLSLDGLLQIVLINGFVPAAGNSFDILDWGSLSGTFSTLQLPALASGLTWDTSQLYTAGSLAVAGVVGDYNHNGIVDAADYVVWRGSLGRTGPGLAADGNLNGTIDASDYTVWMAHFGQFSGSGSGTAPSAAVPEPVTQLLLTIGSLVLVAARCRQKGEIRRSIGVGLTPF